MVNLETATGRPKGPYDIGVPREKEKVVVTLVVMRPFSVLRGAAKACGDFGDPTAVSRVKSVAVLGERCFGSSA